MDTQKVALVLVAGLALGSSTVMARFGLSEIPPLMLVMLRLLLATLLFAIILLALRRKLPRQRSIWFSISIAGTLTAGIPLTAFTLSLQTISSGVLTVFFALIPLLTSLMAHQWLAQEKLHRGMLAGLVLGLAGVFLVIVTGTTGLAAGNSDLTGYLLALGGVVVSAVGTVYTRRWLREVDALVVTAGQILVSFLISAPFALALNRLDLTAVTWRGGLAVLYMAVVGSCIGFLLLFFMIQRYGATVGTLPGYVVPLVAAVLGALLLGELITLPLIIGATLTLFGVFLASR